MADFAAYLAEKIVEYFAEDKLKELFEVLMKKNLAAADWFAKHSQNAVNQETSRRHQLTDKLHRHITNNFPDATAHIAREIHTTSRKIATASNPEEVLVVLKEIADHIIRHLTFGGNVVETGILPAEFCVLIDMGANCADFLTEEERTGITQSIQEYVEEMMVANF